MPKKSILIECPGGHMLTLKEAATVTARATSAMRKTHGAPQITCTCGECQTCKNREYQRKLRAKKLLFLF